MILPLTYAGNPVLYKKCKEVPVKEIMSAKVQTFLNDMSATIDSIEIAAGLAAPQVNKEWRLFGIKLPEKSLTYEPITPKGERVITPNKTFYFINPKLSYPDPITAIKPEACLSVPYYYGMVERHNFVKVSAYTREGKYFEILASKFLARVIQHEYDHLDGILWLDRVKSQQEIIFNGVEEQDEVE